MSVALVHLHMKTSKIISPYNVIIVILLILTSFRLYNYFQPTPDINENVDQDYLVTAVKLSGNVLTLNLKGEEKYVAFYYLDDNEEINVVPGNHIHLTGTLSLPKSNSLPNTFNYQKYLQSNDIHYQITISQMTVLDEEVGWLYRLRNHLMNRSSSLTNQYINALIFANNDYIADDVANSFQINGVSHLLAISGMHINLLCLIFLKLLKKWRIRYPQLIINLFLIFYLFLTNFTPSIVRASIFYFIVEFSFLHKLSSHKCLNITILICLLLFPYFLINLSFQYSVITSFFLTKYSLNNEHFLKQTLAISLLAFFASLPLTVNNFYRLNFLSPLLNIIFVPLISFLIYPLVLLAFIFPFLSYFLDPILYLFQNLSLLFSQITCLIIQIPKFTPIYLIIYYLLLLTRKNINYRSYFILILLIFFVKITPYLDPHGYVYFLDVGQGDSALIISPYQKDVILLDTGGLNVIDEDQTDPNIRLATNMVTFFQSIGISHIDNLIISHGDNDHLGTAKYLIDLIAIQNITLNPGEYTASEAELLNMLPSSTYIPHNLQITYLKTPLYESENDNSNVNLITIYHTNFLFTGDISSRVEEDILNRYQFSHIHFLKLAHHGSNTSNSYSFLKNIAPQYAIISSGLNNRYHHPSKETIENLAELNIPYYNTAFNHTIKVKISKKGFTIYPLKT